MQKLTFVPFLAALVLTSFASDEAIAQKVTVAQLEQALAAAKGKPDADVAQRLAGFELTERLNSLKLAKLKVNSPERRPGRHW